MPREAEAGGRRVQCHFGRMRVVAVAQGRLVATWCVRLDVSSAARDAVFDASKPAERWCSILSRGFAPESGCHWQGWGAADDWRFG